MRTLTWEEEQGLLDELEREEEERIAEFPLGLDGPCLYLRRSQPFGFFEVGTEKGPVPMALQGRWTDLNMAKMAVQNYVNSTVSPAKFNPKGEPAKIKSPSETQRTKTLRDNFKAKKTLF